MIWRPWDNRKIAGTGTVCHCVVNVPAVMCSQIIPYEYTMEISARNIVRLNICAHVVTEITEYVEGGTNIAYTPDPASRTLNTPSNMWRQCQIPLLNRKDDSGSVFFDLDLDRSRSRSFAHQHAFVKAAIMLIVLFLVLLCCSILVLCCHVVPSSTYRCAMLSPCDVVVIVMLIVVFYSDPTPLSLVVVILPSFIGRRTRRRLSLLC